MEKKGRTPFQHTLQYDIIATNNIYMRWKKHEISEEEHNMSKHVLILSASPRRNGNSDTLCNQFMKGASEAGHQAEKIFLRDKKINYCMGCGVCNSIHKCVQGDDMAEK